MQNEELIEYINKYLKYDDNTGIFYVKKSRTNKQKIGSIVGTVLKNGYIHIGICGKKYYAHRLAYLVSFGYMPEQVDHTDHCRTNNSISNLRDANATDNARNRSLHSNNTSGVMGVYWKDKSKRWESSIRVDGKSLHLGRFIKFSDAVDARKNAEVLYGFHTNHGKD